MDSHGRIVPATGLKQYAHREWFLHAAITQLMRVTHFPNKIDCGTKSGTDGGRKSCRVAHSFLHFSQHSAQAFQFHNDRQIVSLRTVTLWCSPHLNRTQGHSCVVHPILCTPVVSTAWQLPPSSPGTELQTTNARQQRLRAPSQHTEILTAANTEQAGRAAVACL